MKNTWSKNYKIQNILTVLVLLPLSKSQILIVRSCDPVSKLLVTKENFEALIVSLWPEKVCTVRIVFKRHTMALCSVDAPARCSLSKLKETSVIALLKPLRLCTSFPFAELQSLIKLSAPPVAIASPIVLNARQVTSCLCAAILNSTLVGTLVSPKGLALRYSALMNWSRLMF